MPRSRRLLRGAASLAFISLLAACSDNGREPLLSQVEPIDIPAADTTTRTNVNINNPTLDIPTTYPVADGDLLTLVWSDEFDGAELDPETWFFESGDGSQYGIPGWGNDELQWYLPDSARLEGGRLIIEARRETVGSFGYTSARITTQDRLAVRYGRIEARMKLPAGQGLWPAFWMLPQDDQPGQPPADGVYGGFSASGEIDIMEAVNLGGNPGPAGLGGGNEIFGTIHFGGEFPANQFSTIEYTPSESVTDQFNNYAVEWDEFEIRWYFNGILFAVQNNWNPPPGESFPAPFDQPFKILLNLAVGGSLPGSPDGSTPFPATMEVDWVRVYSGEEPPPADPSANIGVYSESNTDPFVNIVDVITAGNPVGIDLSSTAVTPFDGAVSLAVTYSDNTAGNFFGLVGFVFDPIDVSQRTTLKFAIDTSAFANLADLTVQIEPPGGGAAGTFVSLSSYTPVSTTGNWDVYEIPVADFPAVDPADVQAVVFANARDSGGALIAGTLYLDDIHFTAQTTGGGGGGPFDSGLLTNGDFEAGTSPWLAGVTNPIGASNVIDDGTGNQVYFVDVMAAGNSFDVNLSQKLAITPDETYTLTFKARSNVNRSIIAGIGLSGGSFANTSVPVDLTTAWQTFTLDLTATGFGDADSRVLFDLGAEVGEVYIDDVSLVVATGGGGGGNSLATNGDFETGDFSGWQQFVNSGVQSISNDTPANGGSFSAAISGNTAPGNGGTTEIKQANVGVGTLQVGDVLTISFDVKGTFGPGGQLNVLSFTEFGGGGADLSDQTVIAGGVDDWTPQSYQVTLSGSDADGGFSLAFNPVCGAVTDCVADVFIDNVSIELN